MIKQVFLGALMLSSLGSLSSLYNVRNVVDYDFKVDFGYTFNNGEKTSSEWEFKFGQKFVLLDGSLAGDDYLSAKYNIIQCLPNNYVQINSISDFDKLLELNDFENALSSSYWEFSGPVNKAIVIPISDYKLSGSTFNGANFNALSTEIFGLDSSRSIEEISEQVFNNLKEPNPGLNIQIYEKDTSRPVIDGYEGVYVTSVDNPVSVDQVKAQLTAHDEVDGDLTDEIKIDQDNYTGHEHEVGEYDVVFSVSDKSGNKATLTIKISVVDGASPVFSGPSSITSNLSSPLDLEAIKSQISVTDNYDKEIQYTIETDEFSGKENIPGTYKIVFKAVDSSTNATTKTVTITVKDDVKPTISGNATYKSGYDQKIELDTIKNALVASDNVDTIDKSSIQVIEDGYSENYNKPGTYKVKFQVADQSGNQSEVFEVTINVVDEKLPVFEVSNFIINLDYYSSLSHEDIVELLASTGQIDLARLSNPSEQVLFVTDEYAGTDKPGTYLMRVNVKYDDGEEKNIEFKLNKLEQQVTEPDVDLPWYQDVWNWCVNFIFEPIGNFFKSAWDWIVGLFK